MRMRWLKRQRPDDILGLHDITGFSDALVVTHAIGALCAALVALLLASGHGRSFTEGMAIVIFSWAISSDVMLEVLDIDKRITRSAYLRLAVPYRRFVLASLALVAVALYGMGGWTAIG